MSKTQRHCQAEGEGRADDWMTAQEFASQYHVSRSTAYDAFKRLDTIRIGGCLRARRSEIEDKLARYGRV